MTILVHPELSVPSELASQYARVLESLAAHTLSHGLNVELLRSPARVYSVRMNHKARLLIAPFWDEKGQMSWVILDCLDEHKYHSIYLRISQVELEQRILALRAGQSTLLPPSQPAQVVTEQLVIEQELVFYQSMMIQLTTEQNEVVTADLPLVVNGVAGSGKTCVGLSTLRQAALAWKGEAPPIVYVATSAKLVAQMKHNYELAYGEDEHVLFLTYQQVLERALRGSFTGFVNNEALSEWLTGYIQKHKQLSKFSTDALCREFRQVCLCRVLQDYLEIGTRHSLLVDEDKKEVFAAYQAYRAELTQRKLVHPDLYHEAMSPSFSLVVADESQDLSPAALNMLSQLVYRDVIKRAPQIMYLADANQSLENGNLLVLHHLTRLVREENIKTLPVSHRCPGAVIEVANRLLSLRNSIAGGVYDKYTQSSLKQQRNESRGEVRWVDTVEAEWSSLSERPDFAVVTSAAYVEEAMVKFNTPLVFIPKQIKGLEYNHVVVYRLFEEEVKAINDKLRKEGVNSGSNRVRRDELTQEHVSKAIYLNEVFTAFTRALHTLIIFQARAHHNQEIIAFLNPGSQISMAAAAQSTAVFMPVNSTTSPDISKAWELELKRQEEVGNEAIVKNIRERQQVVSHKRDMQNAASPETVTYVPVMAPQSHPSTQAPPTGLSPIDTSKPISAKGLTSLNLIGSLSRKLVGYVESFLTAMASKTGENNIQNVTNLLNHKQAYELLFERAMHNEYSLFENLIASERYAAFKGYISRAGLVEKYVSLLRKALDNPHIYIFAGLLIAEWKICNQPILDRWKQNELEMMVGLCELVLTKGGIALLDEQWPRLKPFTLSVLNRPFEAGENKGKSLFYFLVSKQEGAHLLKDKWHDIKSHITEDLLNRFAEEGELKGINPCFFLMGNDGNLLMDKWIHLGPLLTIEGFNRPAEAGLSKGKSAFFFLVSSPSGRKFLKDKWDEFKSLLSPEGFNRPAEEGVNEGVSPFCILTNSPDGSLLLKNKWSNFRSLLTAEGLNRPAQAGEGKGASPLYWLAFFPENRQLLKDNWEDFKPHLTKAGLNKAAETRVNKGKSPLYWFACSIGGPLLLKEKWDDLKSLVTPEGFNRPVEEEGNEGISPIYILSATYEGRKFLHNKWSEIRPLITKEGFNHAVEAGHDKGRSPLYWLASRSDGLHLLQEKWDEVHPLLTIEGFNQAVETGQYQGVTPLICFAEHCQLIKEKWDEFRPFLTKKGFNYAPKAGEYKGKSAFFCLTYSAEGRALLKEVWGSIKPLLTKEGLNNTFITKENKSVCPLFYLICGSDLILDNLKDMKSLFTIEDLNRVKMEATTLNLTMMLPSIDELIQRLSHEESAGNSKYRFHAPTLDLEAPDKLGTVSRLQSA